jgi:hypothetical protein
MSFSQAPRRSGFTAGIDVRLSDGATWTLPVYEASRQDAELAALVASAVEAEDRAEALRFELALLILLLSRNYDLAPDQIASLLTFPPGAQDQAALQAAVHRLVLDYAPRSRAASSPASAENVPHGQTLLPDSP